MQGRTRSFGKQKLTVRDFRVTNFLRDRERKPTMSADCETTNGE
jgi:hypothetical protein